MQRGFSLIETLVVVLIIGILTSFALPNYFRAAEKARQTEIMLLWGRYRGWFTDAPLSAEAVQNLNERLEKAPLKYYTARLICRPKSSEEEKCWEFVFDLKNADQSVRYRLTTTQNGRRLACSGLNTAGTSYCKAQREDGPFVLDGYETYLIK